MYKEVYFPSNWMICKAAYLFFYEGKSQKEIGSELGVSNVTVSRLIQKAKEQKIVKFVIQEPYLLNLETAKEIEARYHLRECIVAAIPQDNLSENSAKEAVALEGARYLQRIITERDILGIAWGKTMYYLIKYLNPCQRTNAVFVTLHGSIATVDFDLDVLTLTTKAAMSLGGQRYCLFSNGLLDSTENVKMLKKEKNTADIFELYSKITISLSGIGALYPKATTPLVTSNYMSQQDYEKLVNTNVYGDIMLRFFDENGNECDTDLRDRTLSIELDAYKKIPTKILAVSGVHKAAALKAALVGKMADVLIIDEKLAAELIMMK